MVLDELKETFRKEGVLLVEVAHIEDLDELRVLRAVGAVDDYLAAIKALSISAVFVYAKKLEERDFRWNPGDDEIDDDLIAEEPQVGSEELDLCAVNPELRAFKQHVGQAGRFTFYASIGVRGLGYILENEWFTRFRDSQDSAIDSVEQQAAEESESHDKEEEQRRAALTEKLEQLMHDKKFARLPTQKAKIAYAKLNISEIDELGSAELRNAISELTAKIAAVGDE